MHRSIAQAGQGGGEGGEDVAAVAAAGAQAPWASTAMLLAVAAGLAPAIGVPHEYLLQDTLKSIVIAFATLGAALQLFWDLRTRRTDLRWDPVLWLPVALMAYALGSMAWSHAYLAGVEAIRWFLVALLAWLTLQVFTRERVAWLAWGLHAGALVASLWTVLQFWVDLRWFPQGPNPASTFVNRNFYAEFVVCTLPFSLLLLGRARSLSQATVLAASNALVMVGLLMTGTRSALVALWLLLALGVPLVAWRCRDLLGVTRWPARRQVLVLALLAGAVLGLGAIPSGNASILEEGRGHTALERALRRTGSIAQPADEAVNIRFTMWRDTLRLIADHPLAGVGAGAWEVQIPRYQQSAQQLESDFYPHNDALQLVAEDGLVGLAAILLLLAWLARSAWRTWRLADGPHRDEVPWRAAALGALLALLLVGNAGFPLRLAATGALLALCVGVLAGSDARIGFTGRFAPRALPWRHAWLSPALGVLGACVGLALFITQQAAACEARIVRATQLALGISRSGDWNDPRWDAAKAEVLRLTREAVAINPHYRKITPMVADELGRWGDWENATWVWDSVLDSRPYIVAILANVARGQAALGHWDRAAHYLERARQVAPDAPTVLSLHVILLSLTGHDPEALDLARQAIARGKADADLLQAAFVLGWRGGDLDLAERAITQRLRDFPRARVTDALKLGSFYLEARHDEARAIDAWRTALASVPPASRNAVLARIPEAYRSRVTP